MFSIKGTYIEGKIHLSEPLHIKGDHEIMVTTLTPSSIEKVVFDNPDFDSNPILDEIGFNDLRHHQRFKANGEIALYEGAVELHYPLYDYSAGGLSFLSPHSFDSGHLVTAGIQDPFAPNEAIMDFEFEVMRVLPFEDGYKIGCRFIENTDEEIWHSLMG